MADKDKNVDLDIDIEDQYVDNEMMDAPDLDQPARPSLREAWESNPVMKLAALGLGAVVVVGGYLTFFGGSGNADNAAQIISPNTEAVNATPGTENPDQEYIRALQERNQQEAQKAFSEGGSALPVPIGTAEGSGLTVPTAPEPAQTDPLTAWRREAESRRLAMEQQAVTDEEPDTQLAAPEVVPMVQPVRPQPQAVRADPEAPQRLAAQMRVVLAAQSPGTSRVSNITVVPSAYADMKRAEAAIAEQQRQTGMAGGGIGPNGQPLPGGGATPEVDKVILSAGSIVYGQLMNQLNSDLPGPVLVSLLSGPFAGGRAIGQLQMRQEYLILTFSKVIKDGVVYQVEGVALDEETTLTGHRSSIDRHYFSRVILPAAARFVQGYASAVAETGTSTTVTGGGGVVQDEPEPDAREEALAGVEEAAEAVADIMDEETDRPVTVHVDKGTTLGILFTESVTASNAR
jgi:intracellular multiplication protein IcmE